MVIEEPSPLELVRDYCYPGWILSGVESEAEDGEEHVLIGVCCVRLLDDSIRVNVGI